MGNCKSVASSLPSLKSNGNTRKLTLALVGLDNAGKTVTARCLEGSSVHDVTPTIGFSTVEFSFENYLITLYDLGGGARIRDIWCKYYAEVYGFAFVVDSSNESRMEECHNVLKTLLHNDLVRGKPVLILANKQDVEGALDEEDIIDVLELEELANQYKSPCRVETCAALCQHGQKVDKTIQTGFRWLTKVIETNWEELNKRVQLDVAEKTEKDKVEKQERAKRVQLSRELREQEERNLNGQSNDVDDEPNTGVNPFMPIDQQLAAVQRREALSKGSKSPKMHSKSEEKVNHSKKKKVPTATLR